MWFFFYSGSAEPCLCSEKRNILKRTQDYTQELQTTWSVYPGITSLGWRSFCSPFCASMTQKQTRNPYLRSLFSGAFGAHPILRRPCSALACVLCEVETQSPLRRTIQAPKPKTWPGDLSRSRSAATLGRDGLGGSLSEWSLQ